MSPRREMSGFALVLGALVAGFLAEALIGGRVLSPADFLFVSASFRGVKGASYEPVNRLLTDPVLQFQPWMELNRSMLRQGRLPLWNSAAGCGTPHLANAQSAVFDPFHVIAYLGQLPEAYATLAAARLWFAGLGMFLLARRWGLGPCGRWFAGLCYPFCGFLVFWLLYPVTNVAVWMPWLFLATDAVLDRPGPRRLGALALAVGGTVLGGHIQTTAHVLLAAASYVAWRALRRTIAAESLRPMPGALVGWAGGVALGVMLAAVTIVPLGTYLSRSAVWGDRARERPAPWALTRPRVLDSLTTIVPYAFGSQRRGHPNLARALGVHNVNESAGGYAGMATALWLAPQAWGLRRRRPRIEFLAGLTVFGFLGAFGFPPVANLLRAVPVLDVMDQRRLTLWLAFGLVGLGAFGIDRLTAPGPNWRARWWVTSWAVGGLGLGLAGAAVSQNGPWLLERATAHYDGAVRATEGADPALYRERGARQVASTLRFVPITLGTAGVEMVALAGLAMFVGRRPWTWPAARLALLGLTVAELFVTGREANPAIDPADDRPETPVVARLRALAGSRGRVLGVGEEWPPNVAMRYGLADPRNYDSVELAASLDRLGPLFGPSKRPSSSRGTVSWAGVVRARSELRNCGVAAVVGGCPPPTVLAERSERIGDAWVVALDAAPFASLEEARQVVGPTGSNGHFEINLNLNSEDTLIIRETFDPGWRAVVDGRPAPIECAPGGFLSVRLGAGAHRVSLTYDPPEVRIAVGASLAALSVVVLVFIGPGTWPRAISASRAWTLPSHRVRIEPSELNRPARPDNSER